MLTSNSISVPAVRLFEDLRWDELFKSPLLDDRSEIKTEVTALHSELKVRRLSMFYFTKRILIYKYVLYEIIGIKILILLAL